MTQNETFKFNLKGKEYTIPSNFRSVNNVKSDILQTLKSTGNYQVQSDVSEGVFEGFLDNWVKRTLPDMNLDNIDQYEKLSKEFELMKDLVETFKRLNQSSDSLIEENNELEKQIQEINDEIEKKTKEHHQIYSFLFNNNGIDSHEKFIEVKDELFDACQKEDVKMVDLLTRRKATKDGLLFALDDKELSAGVFRNVSATGDIVIPISVNYNSSDYVVKTIYERSFKDSNSIRSISFPEESELTLIEKDSFSNSSIESILIPPTLNKIEEDAFQNCQKLTNVRIPEKSDLQEIDEKSFNSSPNVVIEIPSKLKDALTVNVQNENMIKYVD